MGQFDSVVAMGESGEPPMWDLSPLVESQDPQKVKRSMDECLKQAEAIEKKYKGRIKDLSPSEVYELYYEVDTAQTNWKHVFGYAILRQRQDAEDRISNEILEYGRKIDSEFRLKLVFFEIEIARTLVERPEIISDPAANEYIHTLEKARERGKYLLSERDEFLIIDKDRFGIDGWYLLHGMLKSTRKYNVTIKGEEKELGFIELKSIAESDSDRNSRKVAAEALYKGLSLDRAVLATAIKCLFGDYLNQVKLRKYPSILTKSLMDNDISQSTLDAMITSIKDKTHLIRRFLELRAEAMGLPKLTGYDISPGRAAPFAKTQSNIPWSEARRLVIESFTDFDKEAGDFATSLFDQKRIDASIRPSKFGQAFCAHFPTLRTAYILTNYSGSLADISSLAHESGHGLHAYYASERHKWINFHFASCFAETGSILGQMLLIKKILNESRDDETKLAVLDEVLCGLYTMVYYILNDYLFEHSVFAAMENNETIDAEKLDLLWITAREEIFGDSVEWLPGMEQAWMIPTQHFWPRERFYNYPYAFGELLVFVLYQLYKEEGAPFVSKIKHILSAGDSESPEKVLAEVGLDLTNPMFWELGFKQAQTYLDEYEQLINKLA